MIKMLNIHHFIDNIDCVKDYYDRKTTAGRNKVIEINSQQMFSPELPCDAPSFIVKIFKTVEDRTNPSNVIWIEFKSTSKPGVYTVWTLARDLNAKRFEGITKVSQSKYDMIRKAEYEQ